MDLDLFEPNNTAVGEGSQEEIHLIVSFASLLSGRGLSDCQNAEDPSCTSGVATLAAWSRQYAYEYNASATIIAPRFDYSHPFTQQHPLGWDVNRLVFQELLGWKLFLARLWFLESDDSGRNVEGLQSKELPLLISNAIASPADPWSRYVQQIHFDEESSVALMHISEDASTVELSAGILSTCKNLLDYIHRVNQQSGCISNTSPYDSYVNRTYNTSTDSRCWIPVILSDLTVYRETLLDELLTHEHPPALFVDYNGIEVTLNSGEPVKLTNGDSSMWALSYRSGSRLFPLIRLTKENGKPAFNNVMYEPQDLRDFPESAKDASYASDIGQLRVWADAASANDPVVGQSTEFPEAKTSDRLFVRCEAGECEHGNLFTDAMRWATDADFAFENGGAYNGPGWPAGDVRVSLLWETIPFANNVCEGYMSGLNLWKLTNHSVSAGTFSFANTAEGGNVIQVSGLRVTYNTLLDPAIGRLVDLKIWNATQDAFVPIERLKIYKFATNSYNCCCNDPFNEMLTTNLNIPGEVPGYDLPYLEQQATADYLSNLNETYVARLEGRLFNDTANFSNLDLSQSEDDCSQGVQYWSPSYQTCFDCPNIDNIVMIRESSDALVGVSGQMDEVLFRTTFINEEDFGLSLNIESIPAFLSCSSQNGLTPELVRFCGGTDPYIVPAGGQLNLELAANFGALQPGVVKAVVIVDVSDGGDFPGCRGSGMHVDVELQVLPTEALNQLGNIRIVGFCLAGFILCGAVGFGLWCLINRQKHSVKLMQPLFLVTLCCGIFVMGSALIPMSLDDEIVSKESASTACMAGTWLLSLGFSISFAALYAKLKRVNTIVTNAVNFRRIKVRERDVLGPMALLVVSNFIVLMTWSFVDPLRFERDSVIGQPWNTYGLCRTNDTEGVVLMSLLLFINFIALATASWEAYKARNVSKELSEASRIGMAIFSWAQIALIGFPVLFLLDPTNTVINYFMRLCIVFFSSMSLLLWIFVPLVWKNENAGGMSASTRTPAIAQSQRRNDSTIMSLSNSGRTNHKAYTMTGMRNVDGDLEEKEESSRLNSSIFPNTSNR
ncbi:unnamed protein product [Cylindrotheca closterium]|uniref:G-protein coupled receptors family 3 profile domain-containing protein n=1 Tax=Cylindrotheca closterium TaxID=2856 RepID=A0AAD2CN60_9STRA|nr:unnamed protein product [Cylindrotheca closterium]